MTIDLMDVGQDDQVVIQDACGQVLTGFARRADVDGIPMWAIEAFGITIRFAQYTRGGSWKPIHHIKVTGHTPVMVGGGGGYV